LPFRARFLCVAFAPVAFPSWWILSRSSSDKRYILGSDSEIADSGTRRAAGWLDQFEQPWPLTADPKKWRMWQWDDALRQLGFRRRGERYWQCERGFGLRPVEHISIFSWSEQAIPGRRGPARFLVEVTEFHVTFLLGGEHLHFYYHEHADHEWVPAGHTSANEIRLWVATRLHCALTRTPSPGR
jgi:hypothetical protein